MTTDTGMIPANPMMESLWWIHNRAKNKAVYNLTWPMTCDGPLDFAALRVAWQAVVDRNDALRGSLHHRDGAVYLSVADQVDVDLEWITIADPGSTPPDSMLRKIAQELHERPFDLGQAPAARLTYVTVGDAQELVLTVHHSVLDGWSIQLLMQEFGVAYGHVLEGRTPTWDKEPVSLRDYLLDAHVARTDGRWDDSLKHWHDHLDGAKTTTLVADRHRYTGTGNKGEIMEFAFSKEAVEGAAAVAEQYYVTPFTVMLAALQTVLALGGAGPDVCTGMVTANRVTKQEQEMVGYVANLCVARNHINPDHTFASVVEQTRDTIWGMLSHQQVPFATVFGALTDSAQAMLRDNIPLIMTYYGPIGSGLKLGDVGLRMRRAPNRTARTDLGIGVWDAPGGFVIESEHNTGRLNRETVLRLFHDLDAALTTFGPDPNQQVSVLGVKTRSGPAIVEHEITPDDIGTTVMPESAAMDQVRRAWTEVLGTEPLGPDEDWFATGGRSLKTVQFASALEAESGVSLDVIQWLTDPTPRRAAEQISGELDSTGDDTTLVEVRDGSGPHVHLVPGAAGSLQDYRDLIAALPADWRVTASQERAPLESVPAMARRYRADLDAAGLRPDLLVGWSMGGQIAFELGTTYPDGAVPRVAVIDSTPPLGYGYGDEGDQWVQDVFATNMAAAFGTTLGSSPARSTEGNTELAMRVLAAQLATATGEHVSAAMLMDRWSTYRRHTAAVVSYLADRRLTTPALIVGADLADYQLDEWSEQFTTAPRVMRVATNHLGVLKPPVIGEIAAVIGELA
jgi:thioesterase domain-containing protein